jgi:hypothetical protein
MQLAADERRLSKMNLAIDAPRPFTLFGGLVNTGSALNIHFYLCSSAAEHRF